MPEAARGTPLVAVVPITAGRTRSRPRAHMYRPTAVWKARAAASRLVMNRRAADRGQQARGHREQHARAVRALRDRDDLVAVVDVHRPGGGGVDHGDHAQADVGGAREGALGVAGLLAVDGCLLEADEPEHRDRQYRAEPGAVAGWSGTAAAALIRPPAGCARPRTVTATITSSSRPDSTPSTRPLRSIADQPQDRDHAPRRRTPTPPRARRCRSCPWRRTRAAGPIMPYSADLQQVVGDDRDQRGAHPGGSAQAAGDEGVERPGVGDSAGHRQVSEREHGQHGARPAGTLPGRWSGRWRRRRRVPPLRSPAVARRRPG